MADGSNTLVNVTADVAVGDGHVAAISSFGAHVARVVYGERSTC